ncbi:MAG: Ribonuclease P protein component [Microgenomates group bacterium Gr01-1014_7]|nr:MAG: Ribonuclease P protein component [Microgenomates group bacterium Gr01-1014_7]
MLPKPKRLNLKKDFKWVASGKKIDSKFLTLFVKTGDNTFPSIGIAVSGKFLKKAHERNRARRLVSSAFETLYSKLPTNISIVALPKQGILSVKSPDVLLDLEKKLINEKIIT